MKLDPTLLLCPSEYELNENGGFFSRGKPYPIEKKIDVARAYLDLKYSRHGQDPTPTDVSRKAGVGWTYAKQVLDEIEENGRVLSPEEIRGTPRIPLGVGSRALTAEEESFLLYLRFENPHRTNMSYVRELAEAFGTLVSPPFISKWFNGRFRFKGNFVVPDVTPLDKYRPENIERWIEFVSIMEHINPLRAHFIDEAKIAGKDFYHRKARKNPNDGTVPATKVGSDFRKSWNIIASTNCNPNKKAFEWIISFRVIFRRHLFFFHSLGS